MKYLLLLVGLLAGEAPELAGAQQPRPPYPHYRRPVHRRLHRYQPKTWRERAPAVKPRARPARPAARHKAASESRQR